jgi:hypothetical protein
MLAMAMPEYRQFRQMFVFPFESCPPLNFHQVRIASDILIMAWERDPGHNRP